MAKCLHCGANTVRSVALSDGYVCYKCFEKLGFEKSDRKYHSTTSYDDIKDGKSVYITRLIDRIDSDYDKNTAAKLGFRMAHYGEERDVNATDEESEIFEVLQEMTGRDDMRFVRKSDAYVSAVIGEWALARFKYTPRAKWIILPTVEAGAVKHRINSPADVKDYADMIAESLEIINKYSD